MSKGLKPKLIEIWLEQWSRLQTGHCPPLSNPALTRPSKLVSTFRPFWFFLVFVGTNKKGFKPGIVSCARLNKIIRTFVALIGVFGIC